MTKLLVVAFLLSLVLCGCQPANITAVKWDSGEKGVNVKTQCAQVDMRNADEMKKLFSQYDGWKMIYLSEYTTGHKIGTDAAVCFEQVLAK